VAELADAQDLGYCVFANRRLMPIESFSQGPREDLDLLERRLKGALDLLAELSPQVLAQVRRDIRRFGIVGAGGDHYLHELSAHVISKDWLEKLSNADVALNVVHEACHARIRRQGILMTRSNAARVERACVQREIALARLLPDSERHLPRLEARLSQSWWDETERRRRAVERLRAVNAPEWMIRITLRVAGLGD
jgi:hypothetical protein